MSATAPERVPARTYFVIEGQDTRQDPVRLVVVQGDERPAVDSPEEPMVMTFPHLVVRELIALLALSLALVAISLVFDAPLESLANPEQTPNPAKAPWYFLGLQELLHYYPPVVSGVVLPGIVGLALAVIPYFNINLKRSSFRSEGSTRRYLVLYGAVAVLSFVFLVSGAHPVWPVVVPLWVVAALIGAPLVLPRSALVSRWIAARSLAFWIFAWFLLVAIALTVVGVFFRGPGWEYVLPWRDGLYY